MNKWVDDIRYRAKMPPEEEEAYDERLRKRERLEDEDKLKAE